MSEGLDAVRDAFAQEVAPASRPRDQAGRFIQTSSKPEPMFEPRPLEGDEHGDLSDGGADPRLLEHERRVADGRAEQGNEGRSVSNDAEARRRAARDRADHDSALSEPERLELGEADDAGQDDAQPDGGASPEGQPRQDEGARYQVTIDGEPREITVQEALRGYVREEVFASRMGQMVEAAKVIDQRAHEAVQARDAYIARLAHQEEEFAALIPREPDNWDALFRENPAQAHELEKNFKHVYGTLASIRNRRVTAQQEASQEHASRTAEYARSEFSKFVQENRIENEADLKKELNSMRRCALDAGFSEYEISTVYDKRMLTVLRKASKYDRIMAAKPVPVQPDRGRALEPGAASSVGSVSRRRNIDDVMRRQAASGSLDDTALVMERLLR